MKKPRVKRKIYLSWLLSYGAVMLCSLLASLLIYSSANEALHVEIRKVETAVLNNTRLVLDNRLAEVMLTASILRQDDKLRRFVHDPYPFYKSERALEMAAGKALMLQSAESNLTIADIYLHSLRSQVTLSSRYGLNDPSGYALPTEEAFGMDEAAFLAMVGTVSSVPTYEVMPARGDEPRRILLLYPVFYNSTHAEGVLILKLEPGFPLQAQQGVDGNFNLVVLGRDNDLLSANVDMPYLERLASMQLEEGSQVMEGEGSRKGDQYLVSAASSAQFGWRYIAVSSLNEVQGSLRSVRDRTVLLFILFLGLGSLTAVLLVRRNYSPIRHLLQQASRISGKGEETSENEFQQLETAIQEVFNEKEKYSRLLGRQRVHMQTVVLTRLIKGRIYTLEQAGDMLRDENMEFPHPHFVVVAMAIENYGVLLDAEEEDPAMADTADLSLVIVKNILEELYNAFMTAQVFEADNHLVCLINLDQGTQTVEQVLEPLRQGLSVIRQSFGMTVTAGVSAIHETYIGIASCYQEATEMLQSARMLGAPGDVSTFDERRGKVNRLAEHVLHLEARRMLINHMLTENYEAAMKIADDYLDVLARSGLPKPCQHLMQSGLIDDLSAGIDALCGEQLSPLRHQAKTMVADLLDSESLARSTQLIHSVFDALIRIRQEKDQSVQHDRKLQEIMNYIGDNLSDYNLSVTAVARAVNLSVSQMARLIRSKLAMSTLDYIQKVRIEQAKKLLAETDLTMNEIARRVGYENFRTLNTLFKKTEGLTGSQYRENLGKPAK